MKVTVVTHSVRAPYGTRSTTRSSTRSTTRSTSRSTSGSTTPSTQTTAESQWLDQEEIWFSSQQAVDNLLEPPRLKTSRYLDAKGRTTFDGRYYMKSQCKTPIGKRHPKILKAQKNGTCTPLLERYYEQLNPKVNVPLAGIPSHPAFADQPSDPKQNQGEPDRLSDPEQTQRGSRQDGADIVCSHESACDRE